MSEKKRDQNKINDLKNIYLFMFNKLILFLICY